MGTSDTVQDNQERAGNRGQKTFPARTYLCIAALHSRIGTGPVAPSWRAKHEQRESPGVDYGGRGFLVALLFVGRWPRDLTLVPPGFAESLRMESFEGVV